MLYFVLQRFTAVLRPNIYECKICGEHHCEHDYPEQEQYMLSQEMGGLYKPSESTHPTFPLGPGLKSGYNPMHLQQQQVEKVPTHNGLPEEREKPSTSANNKGAEESQSR